MLSALNDREGARVPAGVRVIDSHVHLFPEGVYAALRKWFERFAWPIRYALDADGVVDFLVSRGVERVVGLAYSHAPGMAESLNRFMADLARRRPEVIGCGTVLPGEPNARGIVARALGDLGLRGIKIHCHVQCVAPDDPRLDPVYEEATRARRPVVIHAGREPACEGYACDPHSICSAERVGRALRRHPELTLVVPHLGADEFQAFEALLDDFPNLYLDTTMMLADYFPIAPDSEVLRRRADRLLFGSDFPNLPYAWDRELVRIGAAALPGPASENILWRNAVRVFDLSLH